MPDFLQIVALIALAVTGPATAAPVTATDGPASGAVRLVGAWDCTGSASGSTSKHVYSRVDDATLALRAVVHTSSGVTGTVVETFAYDRTRGIWTLGAGSNRFYDSMRLTATASSATQWTFTGTESTQGATRDVRIVYTVLGPDTFVRQHQRQQDGRWLEDGELSCQRTPETAARPSPTPQPTRSSPRPALHRALAVVPRPGATATPLPIPGIIPADVPNPQPTAARTAAARPRDPAVRTSPRPSASSVGQTPTPRPSDARIALAARPSSLPVRPSPRPLPTPVPATPSAQPTEARTAAPRASNSPPASRPSPLATPVALRPSARPTAARIVAARLPGVPLRPSPHAALPPAGEADRAYHLTGNVWSCETLGGLPATHAYTLQSDGTIKLHNVLTIAKHEYGIDETYRFDRSKNAWLTTTGSGAYAGVAPKWLHDKWVFDGTMPAGSRRVPVQMIYSTLGDGAFRRDFVKLQDGTWKTFAAETCHRP